MLGGELTESRQGRDHPHPHELERLTDLQLLDVLGQVAAGHALVDVFFAGQRSELLDPRLHVVAGYPLARRDRLQVDLVDDRFVGGDRRTPGCRRPARRCAFITAIQSCRSATTLCSGVQRSRSSADA